MLAGLRTCALRSITLTATSTMTTSQIFDSSASRATWPTGNRRRRSRLHTDPGQPGSRRSSRIHHSGSPSPSALRQRGKEDGDGRRTERVRQALDFESGSVELAANRRYEIPFREYAVNRVAKEGLVLRIDLVNSGAEVVGASPLTTARYLDKLTSQEGPMEVFRSSDGTLVGMRKRRGSVER